MPHRRHRLKRLLSRFRTGDLHALEALDLDDHAHALDAGDESSERDPLANARRYGGHRMAASVTFAVLFFAGAAFSAGAGDMVAEAVDSATTEAAAPAATTEAPAAAPETTPAEGEDPECTKRMKEFDREECADESETAEPAPAEQPAPAAPEAAPEAPAPDAEQPTAAPSESAPADEAAETDDARPQGLRPVAPKAPNPALARAHARGKHAARPKGKPVLARKPRLKRHESGHEPKQGGTGVRDDVARSRPPRSDPAVPPAHARVRA